MALIGAHYSYTDVDTIVVSCLLRIYFVMICHGGYDVGDWGGESELLPHLLSRIILYTRI